MTHSDRYGETAPRCGASVPSTWIDLSQTLVDDMPRMQEFPAPIFHRVRSMPEDPLNLTHLDMVVHVGTHVDAPCHFIPGGESIDQVELTRLTGSGVCCRVDGRAGMEIAPDDLIDRALIRPGDLLLLDTGWARYFGTPQYDDHPWFATSFAEWLVERSVKLVGVDFATPDLPGSRRGEGFSWPVHQILLGAGVLVAEHLGNLSSLGGCRIEAILAPVKIRHADGAPVRALARKSEGDGDVVR